MKKLSKKILIISLLFALCLISISSVNADVYMNSTNNTIANATENGTNSGDTIYLDEGTYNHAHLNGTEGINISKNLTIIGKGANKTIIDAGGNGRIFNIPSGGILTLINLTLINGNISGRGGAITNEGMIFISDCIFSNNTAEYAGAINNEGDTMLVNGSTFTKNSANAGGAIFNLHCNNALVINSIFTSNSGSWGGGAIYISGHNMAIIGCDFINNENTIENSQISSDIVINYNRFLNNTGYDLDNYGGFNTNIDFNWWGSNNPDMSKIIGLIPNNYFIMNVTNITALDSNGTVTFQYTFKLNNSDSFDATLLPYFVTDVYTNLTSGVITSFDARFDKTFDITVNTSGDVLYTFATDNEIQTLEGNAIIPIPPEPPIPPIPPTPDPVDPVDPDDPTPTPNNNKTSNNPTASAVMKETGIPINLILLVLCSVLAVLIGRR